MTTESKSNSWDQWDEYAAIKNLGLAAALRKGSDIIIPDHEALEWLVSLLFTKKYWNRYGNVEFFDPQSEVLPESQYYAVILRDLESDTKAMECFELAKQAINQGLIEAYDYPYSDIHHNPEQTSSLPKIYTISFFIWAEKYYSIPGEIGDRCGTILHLWVDRNDRKKKEDYVFKKIIHSKFELFKKEPLWNLSRGIIYLLGRESTHNSDDEYKFIAGNKLGKKMLEYAFDAIKSRQLPVYDIDLESLNGKLPAKAKVKPPEFIAWVQSLPLELPMLPVKGATHKNEELNAKARNSYLRAIYMILRETIAEEPPQWVPTPRAREIIEAFKTRYGKEPLKEDRFAEIIAEAKNCFVDDSD